MNPVQDLNNLYFFAKVVDFGSYTAAAKALGLQTSKLSRRIATLEAELGVRLINRTTRRLSLTEAGKTFHRHCLALLDEAQAAERSARTGTNEVDRRLTAGAADRGEVLTAQLNLAVAERATLDATRAATDALGSVEDGIQRPVWPQSTLKLRRPDSAS